jgi:ankyrin repeat protein
MIIVKDCDPSYFDAQAFTREHSATHPAHVAVMNNDLDALRALHEAHGVGILMTRLRQGNELTPLAFAILLLRHAAVTLLLSFGVLVDEYMSTCFHSGSSSIFGGATALQLAAMRGDVAILEALLAPTPEAIAHAQSLCLWAVYRSDPDVLAMLIDRGFDVRQHSHAHVPPILAAAANPNEAFVNMLLAAGGDVSVFDANCVSPLHAAVRCNRNEKVVAALLAAGASVTALAIGEQTPIHYAALNPNAAIMTELLKHCTANDINLVDMKNVTACDLACSRDVLAVLLAHGGEFGAVQSALEMAVDNGNALAVRDLLLKPGIDLSVRVSSRDRHLGEGRTLLHRAAFANSAEIVQMLLDRGLNMEERCTYLRTALHCAASSNGCDALRVLVAAGANLYAADYYSQTALHCACSHANMAAIEVFAAAGIDLVEAAKADVSLVHRAARATDASVLRHLMRHGVDVRSRDRYGQSLYVEASPRCLELLFAAGIDLSLAPDVAGAAAVSYVEQRPILTLLAAGADVDAYLLARASNLLLDGVELLCACGILDDSAVEHREAKESIMQAIKKIAQRQFELMRLRGFEIVVGLQPLGLSALVMCEILAFSFAPRESLIPFHRLWAIATLAKHFHNNAL